MISQAQLEADVSEAVLTKELLEFLLVDGVERALIGDDTFVLENLEVLRAALTGQANEIRDHELAEFEIDRIKARFLLDAVSKQQVIEGKADLFNCPGLFEASDTKHERGILSSYKAKQGTHRGRIISDRIHKIIPGN